MKKIIVLFSVIILGGIILVVSFKKNIQKEIVWIQVKGNSMYPTLENGKLYKAMKIHSWKELKNQDIVVFKLYNSDQYFIKRLWLKPYDRFKLTYKDDQLNVIINEKYLLKVANYKNTSFYKMLLVWSKGKDKGIVGNLQCAVMGDNQSNSQDSLKYGFISCYRIKYKLLNCKPNPNER